MDRETVDYLNKLDVVYIIDALIFVVWLSGNVMYMFMSLVAPDVFLSWGFEVYTGNIYEEVVSVPYLLMVNLALLMHIYYMYTNMKERNEMMLARKIRNGDILVEDEDGNLIDKSDGTVVDTMDETGEDT